MKRSRLYMNATVGGVCLFLVFSVAWARLFNDEASFTPERPAADELAALADFTAITATGNFKLEIVQQADFTVDYEPMTPGGELRASRAGRALSLEGFGNKTEADQSVVRVGLPELRQLQLNYVSDVTVTGIIADSLDLNVTAVGSLEIQNARLGTLNLSGNGSGNIRIVDSVVENQNFNIRGNLNLSIESGE